MKDLTVYVHQGNVVYMETTTIGKCQHCNADLLEVVNHGWVQATGPAASGGAWNYCVESPAIDIADRGHQPLGY